MRDREKILLGTAVALVVLTLPFWWNAGRAHAAPQPELDTPTIAALPVRECVESKAYMRANHMKLLHEWRDAVVRRNARAYVNTRGQEYEISLQNTCMHCHDNKSRFCDECHDYVTVTMDCWNCHVAPEEGAGERPGRAEVMR